jgi:hypothetical protein
MTVQEAIDELMKIEDKGKKIVVDCHFEVDFIEEDEEIVELRY